MDQPPAEDISTEKASEMCVLDSSRICGARKDKEDLKRGMKW
jgi:hypothetical protein